MSPISTLGCAVAIAATCLPGPSPATPSPSERTGTAVPAQDPVRSRTQEPQPTPSAQEPAERPAQPGAQAPSSQGPSSQGPGPQEPRAQDPARFGPGHLVLVVEGDARSLRITHAVAKADPWAGVPKDLTSEFALVARDAAGNELLRVPIDLSKFETDPGKVGTPVVVEGCEVRSPHIGVLVNVPTVPKAARWLILRADTRGDTRLGESTAAALAELLRRPR